MTYKNNFVVVVKSNGKILRENNSTVAIPFSSEYSLLLKNLNSVRAMAKITIDGEDVTGGRNLILQPNSEISLERYIKDGNLTSGNKFKFIEKTESIEKHRGNKIDDGIIRVEFFSEIVQQITITNNQKDWIYHPVNYPEHYPYPKYDHDYTFGSIIYNQTSKIGINNHQIFNGATLTTPSHGILRSACTTTQNNDKGITVAGSYSDQKFTNGGWFPTESNSTVITFQLVGELKNNEPVLKPITVDIKPQCITCGKLNKATNKFCSECGTSLILY